MAPLAMRKNLSFTLATFASYTFDIDIQLFYTYDYQMGDFMSDHSSKMSYADYLDERRLLINAEKELSQSFDKSLLTLSAGAFGLSLVFLKTISSSCSSNHSQPKNMELLYLSWANLGLTILFMLFALLVGQILFRRHKEWLDAYYSSDSTKLEHYKCDGIEVIGALNWAAIVAFSLGIVLLAIFSVINI